MWLGCRLTGRSKLYWYLDLFSTLGQCRWLVSSWTVWFSDFYLPCATWHAVSIKVCSLCCVVLFVRHCVSNTTVNLCAVSHYVLLDRLVHRTSSLVGYLISEAWQVWIASWPVYIPVIRPVGVCSLSFVCFCFVFFTDKVADWYW